MAETTSWLDRIEKLSKIVGTLAVPILLAAAGWIINEHQKRAEEGERQRRELVSLAGYLTDENPRKVRFGFAIIEMMRKDGAEIPSAVIELATFVSNAPPAPARTQTAAAAPEPAPSASEPSRPSPGVEAPTAPPTRLYAVEQALLGKAASTALSGLAPRVFIHIASDEQRQAAEAVRRLLQQERVNNMSLAVPGVQRVSSSPEKVQLRFLKKADREEARLIAERLRGMLGKEVAVVDLSARFETDPDVRPRTYELWFTREPIELRKPE